MIPQHTIKVPSSRHVRMDGTHTGKLSAESVRGRKAECAVQRSILSPGGYQGEGISVPRMRAEMGSPWSVELLRHAENPRPVKAGGSFVPQSLKTSALLRPGTPVPGRSGKDHRYGCCSRTLSGPRSSLPASTRSGRRRQILPLCRPAWRS